MTIDSWHLPDWRLPLGVPRSVWELAHDAQSQRNDHEYVATSPLIGFDEELVTRWFQSPAPLVDLGCGVGRLLLPFARKGFDCVGVDLSLDALRIAADAARADSLSPRLIRANLCELGAIPDAQFRYALLMFSTLGMISGADNRGRALREARRLVAANGELALHVHNVWHHAWNPQSRWWLLADRFKALRGHSRAGDLFRDDRGIPGMYQHAFSLSELKRLLETSGWRVTEVVPLAVNAAGKLWHPQTLSALRSNGWIVRCTRKPDAT